MKYVVSLAAAIAVTLALAGGALARTPQEPEPSAIPLLAVAPHPIELLRFLDSVPAAPAQPMAPLPKPTTTLSIYERTASQKVLRAQGCAAAHRQESGVVVLDFGKPSFSHGGYGTITFADRFAPNRRITSALVAYARGYTRCLPSGSQAVVDLARGTSNYHPSVPSAYTAGLRWGRETNRLAQLLVAQGLGDHVSAAAADDAEPAWDPHFRKTRDFIHGYRQAVHAHPLYDYGSLDGGIGSIWSAKQAFFVAGGVGETRALPEIYYAAQAHEWAELARVAASRYHRRVRFAGVMTQGSRHCRCGFRPVAAHHALVRALAAEGVHRTNLPGGGTNIVG